MGSSAEIGFISTKIEPAIAFTIRAFVCFFCADQHEYVCEAVLEGQSAGRTRREGDVPSSGGRPLHGDLAPGHLLPKRVVVQAQEQRTGDRAAHQDQRDGPRVARHDVSQGRHSERK